MTKQEASERYNIPIALLDEYESWGLCHEVKKVMGSWQYDDSDLERLSMIMTLHDVGFTGSEIETYMRLLQEGDHTKELRMQMLTQKREHALDEIHFKEAQLARLDYLRHSITYFCVDAKTARGRVPLAAMAESRYSLFTAAQFLRR